MFIVLIFLYAQRNRLVHCLDIIVWIPLYIYIEQKKKRKYFVCVTMYAYTFVYKRA